MDFTLSKPETSFARLSLSLSPPSRTSKLCSPSEGEEEKGRKKKYEIFQRKQPGWGEEEEVERENGPAAGGADHAPRLQLGRVFLKPDGAFSGNL